MLGFTARAQTDRFMNEVVAVQRWEALLLALVLKLLWLNKMTHATPFRKTVMAKKC